MSRVSFPGKTGISRRRLMQGAAALGVGAAAGGALSTAAQGQTSTVTRREISDMMFNHPREFDLYSQAVQRMRDRGDWSTFDPAAWGRNGRFHADNCTGTGADLTQPDGSWLPDVHGTPHFLPWHRAYLKAYEQRLHEVMDDDSFGVPYWDWANNPAFPQAFTGFDNPLFHFGRIMDRFSRLQFFQTNYSSAYRRSQFRDFSPGIESGPHGFVHVAVGGDMGLLQWAGFDPIFYSHHANIDRIWESWRQDANRRASEPFGLIAGTEYRFVSTTGAPLNYRGDQLLDNNAIGVQYDQLDAAPMGDMLFAGLRVESAEAGERILEMNSARLEAFGRTTDAIARIKPEASEKMKAALSGAAVESADGAELAVVKINDLRVLGQSASGLVFLEGGGKSVFAGAFSVLGNAVVNQTENIEVDVSAALGQIDADLEDITVKITPPPGADGLRAESSRPLVFDSATLDLVEA